MQSSAYTSLPPTCNNLDCQQRSRLIRSTRKLGALLGTTPHLIEIDASAQAPISLSLPTKPKSKYSRGDGAILFPPTSPESLYSGSASSNSSVTSLALPPPRSSLEAIPTPKKNMAVFSKASRSADAPRPLVLRLNPVAVPASDPRVIVPNSPDATRAPAFRRGSVSTISTPTTPDLHSEAEARRRKMAKLTRTLGENVPPELVFANSTTPKETALPPSVKRSSNIWETGASAWRGEWNRRDIREVQNQLRNLKGR